MGQDMFLHHPMCAMMVTQVEIQEDGGNPTCSSDVDPTWTKVGTNWIMSEIINPVITILIIIKNLFMDAAVCHIVITTTPRSLTLSKIAFLLAIQLLKMSPSISARYNHHHLPPGVLPLHNIPLLLAPPGSPGENIMNSLLKFWKSRLN